MSLPNFFAFFFYEYSKFNNLQIIKTTRTVFNINNIVIVCLCVNRNQLQAKDPSSTVKPSCVSLHCNMSATKVEYVQILQMKVRHTLN